MHFLMLAVAAGAAAIGEWNEGAVLLFLFSFSGALEHYAMERTQKEIRSLFKIRAEDRHRARLRGARNASCPSRNCTPASACSSSPANYFPSMPRS